MDYNCFHTAGLWQTVCEKLWQILGLPFEFCWEGGEGKQQGQTANVRRKRIKERHRVKHLGCQFISMKDSVFVSLFSHHSSAFNHLQAQIKNVKFCQLADILDDMREAAAFFHLPSSTLSSSAYCHQLPAPVCCSVHLHYSIFSGFKRYLLKKRGLFVAD